MVKRPIFIAILCFFTAISGQAQPSQALKGLVKQIVDAYSEEENMQQLQVGIVEGGYTYYYQFEGADKIEKTKTDSTLLFGIGSVTKTFTAALLAAMVAEGVVKLENSIALYLPDSVVSANSILKNITLEQLATHTSGFPKMPRNLPFKMKNKEDPLADYQLRDAYQFLMDFTPAIDRKHIQALRKNEKVFLYSHFGIGLLGHLLETAGRKSYTKLLQQYVLKPLNLKDTKLVENLLPNEGAQGHDFSGNVELPLKYASLYASEGLYSCLRDLLQYTKACMSQDVGYSFLKECFEIKNDTDLKKNHVGLGWFIIERGNQKKYPFIYTHSGKTGGFSTYVAFIEKTQTAVVVLSNYNRRVDDIGIAILELINR
ncbi:MAG: serine hydrolase domain-containing protein [Chitinophagales bacterium]